jgi:hypothetical protein
MPSILNCCPLPAFTETPNSACADNIGQIVEVMFALEAQTFATAAAFGTKATVVAEKTALEVKALPYVNAAVITPSAPTEIYGVGTNDTAFGRSLHAKTNNPSTFTAMFYDLTAAQVESMREIACLGAGYRVYFRTNDDKMIYDNTAGGGVVRGFKIYDATFTSVQVDGLNATNKYAMSFQLDAFWEEDRSTTTPVDYAFESWISLT